MSIPVGTKCILQNLQSEEAKKYNNHETIVTSPINNNGRYEVFVSSYGKKLLVLPLNLKDESAISQQIKNECIGRILSVVSTFIIQHEPYNPVEFNVRSRICTELKPIMEREKIQSKYSRLVEELLLEPWHFLVRSELEKMQYCRIPRYPYKLTGI